MTEEYKKPNQPINVDSTKIYNEIKQLATTKFSFYYKLDRDERQTLLTDTTLKILSKMEDGKVPTIYKDYLGYMMIAIKNGIYRLLNIRETIRNKKLNNSTEDHTYVHPTTTTEELDISDVLIKKAVKKLDPIDRAIIRWKLRGWLYTDIANALQVRPYTLIREYEEITDRLQLLYLSERRQYQY